MFRHFLHAISLRKEKYFLDNSEAASSKRKNGSDQSQLGNGFNHCGLDWSMRLTARALDGQIFFVFFNFSPPEFAARAERRILNPFYFPLSWFIMIYLAFFEYIRVEINTKLSKESKLYLCNVEERFRCGRTLVPYVRHCRIEAFCFNLTILKISSFDVGLSVRSCLTYG